MCVGGGGLSCLEDGRGGGGGGEVQKVLDPLSFTREIKVEHKYFLTWHSTLGYFKTDMAITTVGTGDISILSKIDMRHRGPPSTAPFTAVYIMYSQPLDCLDGLSGHYPYRDMDG